MGPSILDYLIIRKPTAPVPPTQYVFVYGSLMQGHHNNHVLLRSGARFVDHAVTSDPFDMISFGTFPGVLDRKRPDKNARVSGELYEISDADALTALDRLEGHPHFYRRRRIKVVDSSGDTRYAWMYVLTDTFIYRKKPSLPIGENGTLDWEELVLNALQSYKDFMKEQDPDGKGVTIH